ncbi:hypothetical protein DB347_22785 [Opitutaceae bacterium EW11]|nr:hypothetical protein DB347_22785 [Opitutaceae bacterium EW11]
MFFDRWMILSGAGSITNTRAVNTIFVMGASDAAVDVRFAATSAEVLGSPPVTTGVAVSPTNDAPAIGPIVFAGSASDVDGDLATVYFDVLAPGSGAWTLVSSSTISPAAGTATAYFIWDPVPALAPGAYAVRVRAQDLNGTFNTNADITATFVVTDVGSPPVDPVDDGKTPQLRVHRPSIQAIQP